MGKKKVKTVLRLAIEARKASPGYPIGPALGQHSVNIMEFCRAYNDQTASQAGLVIPAEITIYEDRTFTFITKTPPTADLIKKAAGIPKGSSKPPREQAGELSHEQAVEIANGTPYGLAAAVWSGDRDRAIAFARRLRAGTVEVNGGAFSTQAPFGGVKRSGHGREFGRFGMEEFLVPKSLQL